ncbi:Uncharacterized protein Rs2_16068 [Raphanus sativus]|nr:Uncharacterized protein Rs2_16068 [Raphanus sativus]
MSLLLLLLNQPVHTPLSTISTLVGLLKSLSAASCPFWIPATSRRNESFRFTLLFLGLSASSNRMADLMSLAPVAAGSWTNMAPTSAAVDVYPIFRVKLAVEDGKDSAIVIFDTEMSKLTDGISHNSSGEGLVCS